MLAEVPEPRKKKGRRYPLKSILGLIEVGLLCGHKGYTPIATWARTQPVLTKALGFRNSKTPCAAALHNVLKKLDTVKLEQALTQWTTTVYQSTPVLANTFTAVALDGKSLRGSHTEETRRTHLLAAVSHELGIPLAQCVVSQKTNEIPMSVEMLNAFDVAGKVITTDALLTQRAFCQEILAKSAAYVLPVKANQKTLFEDIKDLFEPFSETDTPEVETRRFEALHTQEGAHLDRHTAVETAHGFTTTRTLRTSTLLTPYSDWPGLAQVYEYRISRINTKTAQITHHTQYGITSLTPEQATAEDLLTLRRNHWTIENKVHWIRDTVFGEDASRARTGSIPQVMAALRNAVLAVLRFAGYTKISETTRFLAVKPKLAVNLII
jgi:predicted transposase YbfD/YdcC